MKRTYRALPPVDALALLLYAVLVALFSASSAFALHLDWNGQFWLDYNVVNNYQLDRSKPGYDGGYDTDLPYSDYGGTNPQGAGQRHANWYSAFLRLKPKATVNDAIKINSEFHVGSPIYGFYGRGYPTSGDEKFNFTGSNKNGMGISAQRYWASLTTDIGTFEGGRAPIHWGLGAIWNSGDRLFDRYQSTGDMFRMTSKFGSFYLIPSFVKVSMGNNVVGASSSTGAILAGDDDVTDYNLAGRYYNTEEDFDFGVMWTHRAGNSAQKSIFFNGAGMGSNRINYNLFDFYALKKWSRFSIGGEVPFYSGLIGAANNNSSAEFEYKAIAMILEGKYNSDSWDFDLKAGHVPGQPPISATDTKYKAVYLHKNYGLGLIMFRYNIYGLHANNPDTVAAGSLNSPYGAGIVNANYLALSPAFKWDKLTFKSAIIVAYADTTAERARFHYNHHYRKFYLSNDNQGDFLGWEFDLGAAFKWDESITISADTGLWFPGSYYKFTNHPSVTWNPGFMFASEVKAGINF